MLRLLSKIIALVVVAFLLYGLWLLYQDKTPEQRAEVRARISGAAKEVARTMVQAVRRVVEKGEKAFQERQQEKTKKAD